MTADATEPAVRDNAAASRFEIGVEGHLARLEYRREDGRIVYVHTEVPSELGGRGLGARLAKHALDYAREAGLRVVAECEYVRGYVERNPEYQDLLDAA